MTTLTRTIALLYRLTDADTEQLSASLLETRKRVWTSTLRELARQHGCGGAPRAASGDDLDVLKQQSADDAKSIRQTWNADVERQIEAIYADNPRSNRFTFFRRLEDWAAKRDQFKSAQIALVTETGTSEYAKAQFRRFNYDGSERYRLTGSAPVCKVCIRLFGRGAVTRRFIERHPCPQHIGCGHTWSEVERPRVPCNEMWLG